MASEDPVELGNDDHRRALQRAAIADLIQRERAARDAASWDEMASYYHPESLVDVAWFQGTGEQFVRATQKNWRTDAVNFHEMGAAVVVVINQRALAETACTLHGFYNLNGVDVTSTGFVRLLWRVQRLESRWLIAGLRSIYIRDLLQPCNPGQTLSLDDLELAAYRSSYRYLSYTLKYLGRQPSQTLPGSDRPDTVADVRATERGWLDQGLTAMLNHTADQEIGEAPNQSNAAL
jgi:hypothetical protein